MFFLKKYLYKKLGYIIHTLRKNYGWDDDTIIDLVEEHGLVWLSDQYRYCKEDEVQYWNLHLNVIQFAKTPDSRKGANIMVKAERELRDNILRAFAPWRNAHEERRKAFERKHGVKAGEIVIVAGAGEAGLAKELAGDDNIRIVKG